MRSRLRAPDRHELDALDLAGFANRLRDLMERVPRLVALRAAGTPVTTTEGPWCKHCESKHACASKNALLVQIAQRGLTVVGDQVMTADRAAAAVLEVERIDQLVKDAKSRLLTYTDENGPIELPDGTWYGRHREQGNERLDAHSTLQAIAEIVGEQGENAERAKAFASVAFDMKTSKAALNRAAKHVGAAPALATAVIQRVRQLGGATHDKEKLPVGRFRDREKAAQLPREEIGADEGAHLDLLFAEATP
jgi:hypothetical protein